MLLIAVLFYNGQHLIDGNFWNGLPWTIGIDEWRSRATELQLNISSATKSIPNPYREGS
jgi:hypothetical protein